MLDYIAFLSCLEFAVLNSLYQETILKPKQVLCLESMYLKKDVMCVLPTGYGKSLIFHLLPMLLFARFKLRGDLLFSWRSKGICTATVDSIVIVVSPPNSLMRDQVSRLGLSGIRASVVNIKHARTTQDETEEDIDVAVDIEFWLCEEQKLRDGYYHIVFAHPESFISSKYGRDLLLSETGRAGRNGKPSLATLYYNNRDIGKNRVGMQDDMRNFCLSNDTCLRRLLLQCLDYKQDIVVEPPHTCCSVCEAQCKCSLCLHLLLQKLYL